MRAVHFSNNSLAGAPIRLVKALCAHTGVSARLIDTARFGLYDHDLIFSEAKDEAIELAQNADIIHLHNFLDAASTDFAPIDFNALKRRGAAVVRHFHSTPELIAARRGISVAELMASPTPTLVIAQYPERLFPEAYVVPNLIPEMDPAYRPSGEEPLWDVFFCPTKPDSAWENRWVTKGAPETLAMLERLAANTGCRINARDASRLIPLTQVMREKRASRIVIDDLVNGSYHLSGLEGCALGRAALSFLDERSMLLLKVFSGSAEHPFCNVRLEEAQTVLSSLLAHPGETAAIGTAAREWIERHWSQARLAGHYEQAYRILLDDPSRLVRQPELALDGEKKFTYVVLPEIIYQCRRAANREKPCNTSKTSN